MPRPLLTANLAYLTADIPGIGGVIRQRPEDFFVEELPLYPPAGQGEHLYLYIEKRERTTPDVIRRFAKLFNVRRSDIGWAGLKDKHAVTRQHFSIYLPNAAHDAKFLERLEFTGLKLIWSARHANKLRRGHHAGNRFVIFIRRVDATAALRAQRIMDVLAQIGVPNFIGEQRFGYRQNNHLLGRLLLLGRWQEMLDEMLGRPDAHDVPDMYTARQAYERRDYAAALELWPRQLHHDRVALDFLRQGKTAAQAVQGVDYQQREFLLSSLQSALFNNILDRRLRAGQFAQLLPGDLAGKHDNGAVFPVDGPTAAQENASAGRIAKLEISPTGPMWGAAMLKPSGLPLQIEQEALAALALQEQDFQNAPVQSVRGERRSLRAVIQAPQVTGGADELGPYVRLAFLLPRGSFATVALREIIKPEQTGAALSEEEEHEA